MGYIVKHATFNGRHNQCKSKCFIVLYLDKGYLHRKEMEDLSGEPENCDHWYDNGYLGHRVYKGKGRLCYIYSLVLRGRHFVEDRIPPEKYEQYLQEIKEHQEKVMSDNKFVRDWYNLHFRTSMR